MDLQGVGFIMNNSVEYYVQTYLDLVSESAMWLIRTDFSFEYPRPMMPNMEFIGGFHCKEAKPINQLGVLNASRRKSHNNLIFRWAWESRAYYNILL